MRDATVDKLTKLITDKPKYNPNSHSKAPREVHVGLAEGWFSLVMLAIVVYSTVWCIQAAGWVDHLNILTVITGIGLIFGVIAAKQHRFARIPVHIVALCIGLLLAFWQTVGAFYQGHSGLFITGVQHWLSAALTGQTGNDDSIFLFFILTLGFVLAYASAWFVYRTRNPWLTILANAVVLLINLSSVDAGYIFFLVVFLMASLLLLLRFNLYESLKRWRKQGLRYPDDIGWDVMQAGAIISVCILIFSWILPGTYTNEVAAQIWNSSSNPWQQAENTWNRIISLNGGVNPSNHGNFRDSLALGGNPNLNHDIVFTVDSSDGSVYYETLSYDTYDSHRSSWSNGPTETLAWHANDTYQPDATMVHAVTQKITIVSPLSEQYSYILGAPDIGAYNANASVMRSKVDGSVIAWLNKAGNLGAGTRYDITSYVSSADVQTLRGVPMPANAPAPPPPEYEGQQDPNVYSKAIVDAYTQLPSGLDPRIFAKAQQIVKDAHATTMYDKVVALESYFRDNYSYSTNIQLPSGEEGVSWFLFDNDSHKGFCNYFSTSMVVLARSLGIPARVVAGYTSGEYDAKTHQRVVRGTDAHSWVQVYFAGYGWVNFEPSASFATFTRPLPNQYGRGSTSVGGAGSIGAGGVVPPNGGRGRAGHSAGDDSSSASTDAATTQSQVHQQVFMTVSGVVLLLLFSLLIFMIWWHRLFRRYRLSEQLYGRICLLANWAGIQLKPSQTPYEYLQGVAASAPQDALIIERLGDIYVRDKWADPESPEHPSHSGEINELPSLWQRIQPHLFLYVLRHPYFLRWLPQRVGKSIATLRRKRRMHKMLNEDL